MGLLETPLEDQQAEASAGRRSPAVPVTPASDAVAAAAGGPAAGPAALEKTRSRFLQLAENIPASFWLVDIGERRVVYANAAYETVWGRRVADLFRNRNDWLQAIHPEDQDRVSGLLIDNRRGGMETEFRVVHGDGRQHWLHMRTFPIGPVAGAPHSVGGIAYDVTDFVCQQEALRESEARQRQSAEVQRAVLDALPAQVTILDEHTIIQAANAQWRMFSRGQGLTEEQSGPGRHYLAAFRALAGAETETEDLELGILDIIAGQGTDYCQVYQCRAEEGIRWFRLNCTPLRDAPPHGVLVTHIDITERMQAEQQLTQLAHYDSLTGLPNRFLFRDRLHSALTMARRNGWQLAVLFLDLDRFKAINDSMGHQAGDALLQLAAGRIQACIRESDTVGRLGGDEFALVLAEMARIQDATLVARKVVDSLARPFMLDGTEVFVTASIGITLFPSDADDVDALIRNADTAMYRAKESGRNNFQFFTAEMNRQATTKMQMENDLRRAVSRQEFSLVYQPKVSCVTGRITGFEALIRWQHPRRGMVSPAEFIGVLEDTGLIAEAGEWVLRTACRDTLALHRAGLGTPAVAVNLSGRQLQSEQLFDVVKNALDDTGLEPRYLELELTESFLMKKPETAITTLSRLKALGVHISIDDFGTGYSSLSYLKRFPIDALKVDRSFVQDITADTNDASITRAIITLAHSLKLQVVAEGVETEGQLALLIAHRCDIIQGYYFSRPVPLTALEDMLRSRKSLPAGLLARAASARDVLLVGSRPELLAELEHSLADGPYRLATAATADAALARLDASPCEVVICDEQVDDLPAAGFLARVAAVHPNTVRLLLCGPDGWPAADAAVNAGLACRFLSMPCGGKVLRHAVDDAFQSRQLAGENETLHLQLHQANLELARHRDELARVREETALQQERNSAVTEIAQDILEGIPLPVLGVDEDGVVAVANAEAEALLGNGLPLPGSDASECLPPDVIAWLAAPDSGDTCALNLHGRPLRIGRRPLGGRYRGVLLTFHASLATGGTS